MLIKHARIIDPEQNLDFMGNLSIEDGRILEIGGPALTGAGPELDAKGLVLTPGLVDMHVHFRDPGFVYKEDILTGAAAAAAGGVTTVACMPNTSPVIDSPADIAYVLTRGAQAPIHVLPIGAVTVGQKGRELTDFKALKTAGAVALSDDGVPVDRAVTVRAAMQAARELNLPIISHCEDGEMVQNYAVNEGVISERLGLPGRPAIAEELMAARDILLAEETGARLHIAHVSTRGTVRLIRMAKAAGIPVTAETCPQYYTLTEDMLLEKGALARVNPPLRTDADVTAVTEAVCDGTIDVIVTDHAPHSAEEKARPLVDAPSGMVGLETSLALTLTALYHTGRLSLMDILRRMSLTPCEILGLAAGRLRPGAPADLVLFDPDEDWTVDPDAFQSKGRNTPFGGRQVRGRVKCTIADGDIVFGGIASCQ